MVSFCFYIDLAPCYSDLSDLGKNSAKIYLHLKFLAHFNNPVKNVTLGVKVQSWVVHKKILSKRLVLWFSLGVYFVFELSSI